MIHIKGNSIELKSFTNEEYHQLYQTYISDPMMDPDPFIYDEHKINQSYERLLSRESWYPRVGIFLNHVPIGELSFKRIDHDRSQCELGIVIANDSYKGKGYGTEAIHLAIQYAFQQFNLNKIVADTMGSNKRMQRILNKYGFQLTDLLPNHYDMKDRLEDKLIYELNKPI